MEEQSPPPGRVPGVSPESYPAGSDWARRRVEVYRGRDAALRRVCTQNSFMTIGH
jgi:hypothetical protein